MLVSYESWECSRCGRKYSSEDYRNGHQKDCGNPKSSKRLTNISVKIEQCQHCGKMCTRQDNFKRHERTHTGERPYKCRHCDKTFTQPGNLKTHEKLHTGERP
jgi:uncharacterized Zn-finger protein